MAAAAPLVMGVLNVTPDSFSDGGRFLDLDAAVEHGLEMWEQGAAWVDVGGESTRPGAERVAIKAASIAKVPEPHNGSTKASSPR